MVIMGVDPGLGGAVVFISSAGRVVHYQKMPVKPFEENGKKKRIIDIAQVAAMIAKFQPGHVFIEKVHSMPKQGIVGAFTFGMGYGMLLGLCNSLDAMFKTELIPPQRWQKFMYSNLTGVDDLEPKARAMARFCELWPSLAKQNVTHDGIIDAMLICEYGRRVMGMN